MPSTKVLIILLFCSIFFAACKEKSATITASANMNWAILGFTKVDSLNPIMQPTAAQRFDCPVSRKSVFWEAKNVLNPSAIVKDGKVYLIYRAQDSSMTSRIGLAVSEDGLHFTKQPSPVLFPDNDAYKQYEWKGGIEDPRIVETEDGTYILTYTAYDGKTARLCLATSTNLQQWTKHGLVLGESKYKNYWSKSGAIVAQWNGNKTVATKIQGKYWMYFGDTKLFMATSVDGIHWDVAENEESKKPIEVLQPRPGYFDSRLVEPGPYAILQNEGIVLIYNGSNAANYQDTLLPKFTYSAGQALFDKNNPYKLIARTDTNFIRPDKAYEKKGEVNEVCFVEGLVKFKNQLLLYYGTADSRIAVAIKLLEKNQINTEEKNRQQITAMLDSFNIAAAKADFKTYFNFYTEDGIFIGTDATERWDKKAFMAYAKPHFDKGKAWSFTSLERHIYFDKTGGIAWFDELLNTQMKICRGSGLLIKQGSSWKVKQYVLSASIPNLLMNDVVKMKTPIEDSLIKTFIRK